jgi:hypothetical protein
VMISLNRFLPCIEFHCFIGNSIMFWINTGTKYQGIRFGDLDTPKRITNSNISIPIELQLIGRQDKNIVQHKAPTNISFHLSWP